MTHSCSEWRTCHKMNLQIAAGSGFSLCFRIYDEVIKKTNAESIVIFLSRHQQTQWQKSFLRQYFSLDLLLCEFLGLTEGSKNKQ